MRRDRVPLRRTYPWHSVLPCASFDDGSHRNEKGVIVTTAEHRLALETTHLPADVLTHAAWHHLARLAFDGHETGADGMFLGESYPFDLLLKEAEGAARPRAPTVIFRFADAGTAENINYPLAVDTCFPKGKMHFHIRMRRLIALTGGFIRSDCDIGMNLNPGIEIGTQPLFQRSLKEFP